MSQAVPNSSQPESLFLWLVLHLVLQLNLSFPTCLFLMLMFCRTDQLPLPQKKLVSFPDLYSPRAAHEPQERKEAAQERAMSMLCLTPTSPSVLSSCLPQRLNTSYSQYLPAPQRRRKRDNISPNPLPPIQHLCHSQQSHCSGHTTKSEVRDSIERCPSHQHWGNIP